MAGQHSRLSAANSSTKPMVVPFASPAANLLLPVGVFINGQSAYNVS